jgi:UDP-glucose 4-epimerase
VTYDHGGAPPGHTNMMECPQRTVEENLILITGGMGFIGLHTARRLLDVGEPHLVLTQFQFRREPAFIRDEIGKRVTVEVLDVRDGYDVLDLVRRHQVTGIIHLAVPEPGGLSAAADYQLNMDGLINVLEGARQGGVQRVIIASSTAVYGGLAEGPYRETDLIKLDSTNDTEAFKKAWEVLGLNYGRRTGLEVVMARLSNIWGPMYHSMNNFPCRMALAAVQGKPVDFSGSRFGAPHAEDESDFCYVKDAAQGLALLIKAPQLQHRVYNVSAGYATSGAQLSAATRKSVPEAQVDLPSGRSPRSRPNAYLDATRLREELGYRPEYEVERGMAEYIDWLRENEE